MRIILLGFIFFFCINEIHAQPPSIQWQKSYGGSKLEIATSIAIKGSYYAIVGHAASIDGDVTNVHAPGSNIEDIWFLRINDNGLIFSKKCIGGTQTDRAFSTVLTNDGGFVIAGVSDSYDGDVTGLHGIDDFWVIKVDSVGNIQWQKTLGGSGFDEAFSIIQTLDSGYFVVGKSDSQDGDVSGFHGDWDMWCVKLDHSGSTQWSKALGGYSMDEGTSAVQTSDSGFLIAGSTLSNSGDVTNLHGQSQDVWIVKLNISGQLQWQKCFGGTGGDFANSILDAGNGNYIVSATTYSNDSDVIGLHGTNDFWLFKFDTAKNIVWSKCYGGINFESAASASITTDGGVIMVGQSNVDDGMVSGNNGYYDYWVVKADSMGNFEWGECLGGTNEEHAYTIKQTLDGGFIVGGYTMSNDSDVTFNHGDKDMWIVKLSAAGVGISDPIYNIMDLTILQMGNTVRARFFSRKEEEVNLIIYNLEGQIIIQNTVKANAGINYFKIPLEIATGSYILNISNGYSATSKKFFIK